MKWIAFCGVVGLANIANASPHPEKVNAYQQLAQQDARLAAIGYRLASANAPFCKKLERNLGWVLQDERQYPDPNEARRALIFRAPISVAALVQGGPAERSGIQTGDGLLSLNGKSWTEQAEPASAKSAERLERVQADLGKALASSRSIQLELNTATGPKTFRIEPTPICASQFWVDTKSTLDAGADGENVRITEGLMTFVASDDELAAAVAHEFSHNLLDHRNQLKKTGRKAHHILATEIEADRLSVWLMANAGYDPLAALRFAERFGRKTDLGIFSDATHLRWKNRIKTLRAEIEVIAKTPKLQGLSPPPLLTGGHLDTQ